MNQTTASANGKHSHSVLRLKDVQGLVALSRTTIYRAVKEGRFPPPFPLGARAVGWLKNDIDAWIEAQQNGGVAA